jgi:hypothetical protein
MDVCTAHGLLAELSSDELFALLPPDLEFRGGLALEVATLLPLFAAGMASRSGMLEDNCHTVDDLKAACAHFRALWDAEIVGPAELNAASAEVFNALQLVHEAAYQQERNAAFSQAELN